MDNVLFPLWGEFPTSNFLYPSPAVYLASSIAVHGIMVGLAMAATFCYPNGAFGLNKLNDHFLYRDNSTRFCPVPSLSGNIRRPWFCKCPKTCHQPSIMQLAVKQQRQQWKTFFQSTSDTIIEEEKDDTPRATIIWRAIKLPIYSVALIPLAVASAAAYLQTGLFSSGRFVVLLASSALIITWLNLSNDVYDFDTGADKNKKESVVNILGSRTGTLVAAVLSLILGFMGLSWASLEAGNVRSILLLASAITCGYIYQCPPFRLSYQGLGEPLCFAAFGPFATTAFYLLQSRTCELPITGTVLSASILVGLTTSLILFCSHFHQVKDDMAVGKMSPLVRLGTRAGSDVVKIAVVVLYSSLLVLGLFGGLPITCIILCGLTVPIGRLVIRYVAENHQDNTKIFMAKYYCVRLHTVFGAAFAAGLVAARMVAGSGILKRILP
ncbi:2-carboxy-1,4-naphthoquinone phytyltransferase, chloroplastic isoform X1 [Coffea eugenioides]|uniref:2-carboxy-1,4-naphthoquinone phytyltransferase, chloroplastic isoform X1 n=1 Tax=Coffea eugenioides TaxID=49369 RepID=UPI000F612172|nr:2-carboxy-1,4-naphthoquinone phytyltransferase, chloroplastic isoform X1 [Coffea eugenioides]